MRSCARTVTSTRRASRKTRRCFETPGWEIRGNSETISLDAGEPVDEHVVQKEDLVVEETILEFLRGFLADLPPIGTQVRLDPRAACGDVGLRIFFHPEHGIRPFAAVRGPVAAASGDSRPDR